VRRELEPWLTGRTVLRATLVEASPGPKYAGLERAAGGRILRVARRGKFLILPLHTGVDLIIHLGMTGVLSAAPPPKHTRVKLELSEGGTLYFGDTRRFGRFLAVPTGAYESLPTLHAMGPEPLEPSFTGARFYRALQGSRAPIKPFLLSQKPVSGVGNIYADEALWLARVHPLAPANRVSRPKAYALAAAIREVMTASLAARGTTLQDYRTINGEVGGFLAQLKAYGHAEEPCVRCGAPLRRIVVGGRGTHFCAACQRLPRARSGGKLVP
jgi:formamidopyrimidine-DNA glycosylase